MQTWIVRVAGISAHFRDPRTNTAKIGLPSRTLHCPPPCTLHGLLCAARGAWVEPTGLQIGWRMDYQGVITELQTSRLPQRKEYNISTGVQKISISPVEREILSFPVLSIVILSGVDPDWFRRPVNPLSLGRSEDLIVEKLIQRVSVSELKHGEVERQCLPIGIGSGTIYSAPLYFEGARRPMGMAPRTDAKQRQQIASPHLVQVNQTGEKFHVWRYDAIVS